MDSKPGSVTDQPYEAAIASFGALIAGFSGILGFGQKMILFYFCHTLKTSLKPLSVEEKRP